MKISFFVYKRRGSMNGYHIWKTAFCNYQISNAFHQTLAKFVFLLRSFAVRCAVVFTAALFLHNHEVENTSAQRTT